MANGIAIKDVDNKLQSLEGEEVIPISTGANEPEVVEVDTLKEYINADIDTALEGKQDVINDLDTIRSGAALGTTALQDSDISGWAKASTKPTYTVSEIDGAQEELVSGTNIKTINNESILGSGNITVEGGGGGDVNVIESITFNGDAVAIDSSKNAAITYTAPVTSVNGNTGDVTISTGDTNIIEGIKLDGESSSLTPSSKVVTIPSMRASGSNHRGGLVPDPGSTSGTTKFLREDGSWQVPPSGGGGEVNTIESISVNTVAQTPDANKNVDITVPDVSGKEDSSNKVTSLSSSSTDTQYPSAKCVWDLVGDIETLLAAI